MFLDYVTQPGSLQQDLLWPGMTSILHRPGTMSGPSSLLKRNLASLNLFFIN